LTHGGAATDDWRRLADGLVLQPGQVRFDARLPQLYGTESTVTDRELGPRQIEDPRRAEAGLEPFADYEARMRART
jgi:hypothetical protein